MTIFTGPTNTTTMYFILNREVLLENLQKVLGPTTTKQNFPILSAVLIAATNSGLNFTTTDLDISIIASQKTDVIEQGRIVIPMKRFLSIVRELPPSEVSLKIVKNNLLISCEQIEFKINTLNPEEFPKIEEEKKTMLIKINPKNLEEMLRLTSFCVGHEDTNYVLGGIFFEIFEDKISLVATDGKRLSFIKKKLPLNQAEIKTKASFILPIKAINELYKLIKDREEDIFLFIKENKVGFDFKDTQFIARPIEGDFPNYSQYIPNINKDKLVINRKKFLFALKRADLLSTIDYQGVKLELKKNQMEVSKNTPQLGETKETINTQYSGPPLEIDFNPQYLIDVLKNLEEEEVGIEFFGADKPAIIRKNDYIYLVLPMKI